MQVGTGPTGEFIRLVALIPSNLLNPSIFFFVAKPFRNVISIWNYSGMHSPAGSKRYSSEKSQENSSPQKKQRVLRFAGVHVKQEQPEIGKVAEVRGEDKIWEDACKDQLRGFRIMNNMHNNIAGHVKDNSVYVTEFNIKWYKAVKNFDDSKATDMEAKTTSGFYFQTAQLQEHFLFPSDLHMEATEINSIYMICNEISRCGISLNNSQNLDQSQLRKAAFKYFGGRRIFETADMVLSQGTPTIAVDDVKANIGVFGLTCARDDVERDLWASITGDWITLE